MFALTRSDRTDTQRLTRETIKRLLDKEQVNSGPSDPLSESILDDLLTPLRLTPPQRSAAAEVALVIGAFSIARGRPLNVLDPASPDLDGKNNRLAGDRAVSEFLSQRLKQMNVPATGGALQSSTYRGGYSASQANNPAVHQFAEWLADPDRTLKEVETFAAALASEFRQQAVTLPALPGLDEETVDFIGFRQFCDILLEDGSRGAFEQYLCAALLNAEMKRWDLRATTKPVGVSDASSKAAGDVEIRDGQRLVAAYEVSAASWKAKPRQAMSNVSRLKQITIIATGVDGAATEILREAVEEVDPSRTLDAAFLELRPFLDNLSSRLDKRDRCSAIEYAYQCLVTWHRSEPGLCERFVKAIADSGLAEAGVTRIAADEASETFQVAELLQELADEASSESELTDARISEIQQVLESLKKD